MVAEGRGKTWMNNKKKTIEFADVALDFMISFPKLRKQLALLYM
jgi:hypothetical protein